MFTEVELKSKTVKELKEIAKEVGAPATGKKDELIAAIIAASAEEPAAEEDNGVGLEDAGDELEEAAAGEAAAIPAVPAAAQGKHAAIVFSLESKKPEVEHKKANIVGVTTLSDAERAQIRKAKFGASLAATQAAAGVAGDNKAATAAGSSAPKTLEEQIKVLERGVKYGTAKEADKQKLEKLKKQLEAQHDKQKHALDKVELMDPDKMAAREKKFGKPLIAGGAAGKDPKDPELLKKRAAKFGKVVAPSSNTDDEARKKARLARFAKEKQDNE